MPELFLISGGRKSGKSKFAEKIAIKYKFVTYVALSEPRPKDLEWQSRILLHKSRRPSNWNTIETNELINVLKDEKNVLLIDSIGGFVVNGLSMNTNEWDKYKESLLKALVNYKNNILIVGEQVGWGIVSEYKIGNLFADRLGEILTDITKIADQNWITINGKALRIDDKFIDI
tara:strand:+ start:7689 stop:8210 length:522 start_codon:yes stop_codon:yes gene_type:complete